MPGELFSAPQPAPDVSHLVQCWWMPGRPHCSREGSMWWVAFHARSSSATTSRWVICSASVRHPGWKSCGWCCPGGRR